MPSLFSCFLREGFLPRRRPPPLSTPPGPTKVGWAASLPCSPCAVCAREMNCHWQPACALSSRPGVRRVCAPLSISVPDYSISREYVRPHGGAVLASAELSERPCGCTLGWCNRKTYCVTKYCLATGLCSKSPRSRCFFFFFSSRLSFFFFFLNPAFAGELL